MQMRGGCGMGFAGAQGSGRGIKDIRLAQLPLGKARNPGGQGLQAEPSKPGCYLCACVPRTAQKASREGPMCSGDSAAPVRSRILKARLNYFYNLISWRNATCSVVYRFTLLFRYQSHLCWMLSSGTKLLNLKMCLIQHCFSKNNILELLIVLHSAFTQEHFICLIKHDLVSIILYIFLNCFKKTNAF